MELNFSKITKDNIIEIKPFLDNAKYGRCEYTSGTILMYAEMAGYEYAEKDGVLFIKGKGRKSEYFMAPITNDHEKFVKSVDELAESLLKEGKRPVFVVVPEDKAKMIVRECKREEGYSDYVYDIREFAELKGKKYHGKRNHISRFEREIGEFSFEKITVENIGIVKEFFLKFKEKEYKESDIFRFELQATQNLLDNYFILSLEGYFLSAHGQVIGFTIGEVQGDMLIVHVEKCDKSVHGVYEKIANCMVKKMLGEHPELKYVNREDDAGDEGLKKAKESYHPLYMAKKEKLIFE